MSPYAMAPSVLCRAAWRAGGKRSIAAAIARGEGGRKVAPGGVRDGRPLKSSLSTQAAGTRPPLGGVGTAEDARGTGFGVNDVSTSSARWVLFLFGGGGGGGGVFVSVLLCFCCWLMLLVVGCFCWC